ncbi:MAG: hypothetical protein WDZ40_03775 [Candidatus Spechtbacterales bacterium]
MIKVGPSEELTSVIDKVVTSESRLVFLLIPSEAFIAQNVLNLRLIKRASEDVDKEVVVISEDSRIQNLAAKAGLKVRDEVEDKANISTTTHSGHYARSVTDILPPTSRQEYLEHTTDLRKTRSGGIVASDSVEADEKTGGIFAPRSFEEPKTKKEDTLNTDTEDAEPDMPVKRYDPEEERRDVFSKSSKGFSLPGASVGARAGRFATGKMKNLSLPAFLKKPLYLLGFVGIVAVVVGVGYLATSVLPKATIVLSPHVVQDQMEFAVVADSNISSADYNRSTIPAQILEERKEETFVYKATGEAQLEEFSVGGVTIYNEYSSSPQTLVANTRLMSSENKLFRTTETVVVPGAQIEGGRIIASSVSVDVRADEAGDSFNIGPTTFSIPGFQGDPKYLAFYGKSENSMTGGFQGVATVPTEEDIEGARARIQDEFLPALEQSLRSKVPDDLKMLEESLGAHVESLDIDAVVGEPKDDFTVRFVGVAQAFLIKEEDISNSIAHYFINSTQYSKEFELAEERDVEYTVKEANYEAGYAEFNLKANQRFDMVVDTSAILKDVIGKDEAEVRRILSANESLRRAQVMFWPFWVKSVPDNPKKVKIEVEY